MLKEIIFRKKTILHFYLPLPYLIYAPLGIILGKHILIMSRRSKNHYQINKPFISFFEKILHKNMHTIIGNSKDVVEELIEEGVPKSKLKLIYNGVQKFDHAMRKNKNKIVIVHSRAFASL